MLARIDQEDGNAEVVVPPEENEDDMQLAEAWDDVSGKELDPQKVMIARREEMEYYKKMGVYDKVPIEECIRGQGSRR